MSASHSDKYTFGSYSSNPKDSPSYPEGCLSAESLTKIIRDATKKLPKEETAKYETILQEINDRIAEYDNMRTEKNYHLLLDVLIRNHFFLEADELVRRATNLDKFSADLDQVTRNLIFRVKPGWNMQGKKIWDTFTKLYAYMHILAQIILFSLAYALYFSESDDPNRFDPTESSILSDWKVDGAIKTDIKFADIKGINEFREELEDVVDFIKNTKKYKDAGAYIPKGVLLVGPPGTGKTLMAKAIAQEAGCNFYYRSGSEFEEVYRGVGASRIRKLFAKARNQAPSIIFIDEIDALAQNRSSFSMMNERQTLNQLLTEMDGFKELDRVVLIAATNLPKLIDKAMLRPGRFDKIINVPYPDLQGRREILDYYLGKVTIDAEKIDKDTIVKATTGFSGSAIKNLVNIAVLNAVKNKREKAVHEDFEHALDRVTMGVGRKKMLVSDQEKLLTAYHEGGHTLVNLLVKSSNPLHKVTILPRGPALGFTAMLPSENIYYQNKEELVNSIMIALGGRVAEEQVFGNDQVTTGCSSDIEKATEIAYAMYRNYSMDPRFTIVKDKRELSENYNSQIDSAAQQLMKEALQRTRKLLQENRHRLDKLAKELVEKETMSREEVEKITGLSGA